MKVNLNGALESSVEFVGQRITLGRVGPWRGQVSLLLKHSLAYPD